MSTWQEGQIKYSSSCWFNRGKTTWCSYVSRRWTFNEGILATQRLESEMMKSEKKLTDNISNLKVWRVGAWGREKWMHSWKFRKQQHMRKVFKEELGNQRLTILNLLHCLKVDKKSFIINFIHWHWYKHIKLMLPSNRLDIKSSWFAYRRREAVVSETSLSRVASAFISASSLVTL